MIINNKIYISTIVNKAKEKDYEMTSNQSILILKRMQYLKFAFLFMLQKQSSGISCTFASSGKSNQTHEVIEWC